MRPLAQFPILIRLATTDEYYRKHPKTMNAARIFAISRSGKVLSSALLNQPSNEDTPFPFNMEFDQITFLRDNIQSSSPTPRQMSTQHLHLTASEKRRQSAYHACKWRIPVRHRWSSGVCDRCGREDAEWPRRGPNSHKGAWWPGSPIANKGIK